MPYTLVFEVTVLSFNRHRHLANEESLSSSYTECEEIENDQNHLTWGYSKKLPCNRKKSEKTLAKRPGRGIIAKPSDEGRPQRAAPSRRAARKAGRGAGRGNFLKKVLDTAGPGE